MLNWIKRCWIWFDLQGRNSLSHRKQQQRLGFVKNGTMMQNGGQMQPPENLLNVPLDVSDEEEQQYTDDERSPLSEPIYGGRYLLKNCIYEWIFDLIYGHLVLELGNQLLTIYEGMYSSHFNRMIRLWIDGCVCILQLAAHCSNIWSQRLVIAVNNRAVIYFTFVFSSGYRVVFHDQKKKQPLPLIIVLLLSTLWQLQQQQQQQLHHR